VSDSTKRRKSKTKKRTLSRRQKGFVFVLLIINVGILAGMWALSEQPMPVDYSADLTTGHEMELRDAYKQALNAALGWQSDVQIVGVTTSWRLSGGDTLSLNRPVWSFNFYSPGARLMQLVTMDEWVAAFGPQQTASVVPQPVMPDWDLNSDELLLLFLSYGGEAFMKAHPGANIHLQLKADETGRSVWAITAVDPVLRDSLLVRVDARTRRIVPSETADGGA
jgi:hypothetical protein